MAVVRQERLYAAVVDQLPAQRPGVEQLPIRVTVALHLPIVVQHDDGGGIPLPAPLCSTGS